MRQSFTVNATVLLAALATILILAGTVSAENWKEEVIHGFQGRPSAFPAGGLVTDSAGNLYGTSTGYGFQSGTVFRLSTPKKKGGHWVIDALHTFPGKSGTDGAGPEGAVVFDKEGNLYGTTLSGGVNGAGTVFRLKPPVKKGGSWTETILHDFDDCAEGCGPGGLIFGKGGALYGTTVSGGAYGDGTVYELVRQGAEEAGHSGFSTTSPARTAMSRFTAGGTWPLTNRAAFTARPYSAALLILAWFSD